MRFLFDYMNNPFFVNRGTETEEQIQKRLRNAWAELEQRNSPGLFDHILVNDDLETCYENLKVNLSGVSLHLLFERKKLKIPYFPSLAVLDYVSMLQEGFIFKENEKQYVWLTL